MSRNAKVRLPRRSIGAGVSSLVFSAVVFVATQAMSQPAQPAPAPQPAPATDAAAGTEITGEREIGCAVLAPQAGAAVQARTKSEDLPPPSDAQVSALATLQAEADAYAEDARDYRATLTRIIKHHYQEKRRSVLASLNREIEIEGEELKAARLTAIQELEAFIERYSGAESDPEATPDAMFRLAALYEEEARAISDEAVVPMGEPPPLPDLKKAIALYKRLVQEYPDYRERAAVFYYLGHSLYDMGRLEESQQVWRSLVCQNHFRYPVPPDPEDPEKDSIGRLPQDHDQEWWWGWMSRHPRPLDLERGTAAGPASVDASENDDEEVFVDPYPDDCVPIEQETIEGEDPRYMAEIWWRIGDHHFEEIDPFGGPYNLNRGESAYRQSMRFKKPPVFGVAMYKLAWTFYKQQRYKAAVEQFVELLHYTDEQERLTGNPGADFRAEAYAYIAGSLTYLDFAGPGPFDPYIQRDDIFDTETDANIIEEKMGVAIDRVQDPALIPQDRPWTIEIYRALAFEFKEYNHYHNMIRLSELVLDKWPLHRDAPEVQHQIALVYETLAGQTRGEEHEKYAAQALKARSKLIDYVATPERIPPWVEANKEDPEAIRRAEQLVRGGLRRAAADHTNLARRMVRQAQTAGDDADRTVAFENALAEYRLAARAWGGYLLQDENAEDAYESRFWLADAYTNAVLIQVQLRRDPKPQEVELSRCTSRSVRDSNEDDKYLQPAGMFVVRVAQQLVQRQYQKHEDGVGGYENRTKLQETEAAEGDEEAKTYVTEEIPPELKELVVAFDEYIARVPLGAEPNQDKPNHLKFAYLAGEIPFLYGQFEEAKKRLNPIYQQQCGETEYGYLAWEKLITMANKENDYETSRALAQATKKKSCAVDEAQKVAEEGISNPTIQRGFFQEAAAAYDKACRPIDASGNACESSGDEGCSCTPAKPEDGPERAAQWRKAAELYEGALREAPDRKEAPEAAILGASSYKQIGEYDKAIAMYELFIKEYGSDENMTKLEKGDPSNGVPPKPEELKDRVTYLKVAYDALAEAYVLFFDYRRAAATYDKIAGIKRFEAADRRQAARNAVYLYGNIGERAKMEDAKKTFFGMNPSAEERAEVEWLVSSADLKDWDANGPDTGSNKAARLQAIGSMDSYYNRFKSDGAASQWVIHAAYNSAKMRRKGQDPRHVDWCKKTVAAFGGFKSAAGKDEEGNSKALGSPEADMAAECHYREIEADVAKNHDYDAGHHRYTGEWVDVLRKQFKDAVDKDAKAYYDRFQEVIDTYLSRRWAVAARGRQGSLYDSPRTGLYNAREPGLKLYSAKEEKTLKQADDLCVNEGNEKACEVYDTFTAKRRLDWRQERDKELAAADKAMVRGYAEAVLWARAWKVRVDAVDHAIARLAFFTEIIGNDKLREYTTGIKDPATKADFVYQDNMFVGMRRGKTTDVNADILPSPLPISP